MGTTSIIVELVIIGFQGIIWLSLVIGVFFGYDWIDFSKAKDWVTILSIAAIAVSYTLGLIFNSVAATLFGPWRLWVYRMILPDFESTTKEFWNIYSTIMLESPDIHKHLERIFNEIRLLRATVINLCLIAIFTIIYVVMRTDIGWQIIVFIIVFSFFLIFLAIWAWKRAMRRYYKIMTYTYKILRSSGDRV